MARALGLLPLTTVFCFVSVGAVLAVPKAPCCQDVGLFELPKVEMHKSAPPEGCKAAVDLVAKLLPDVEAEIEDPLKTAMKQAVANREKDETLAEGWDSAASLALLNLHVPAALWAELTAIQTSWDSDFVVDAGVYLALMKHDSEAKTMLHCAYDDGNRSPYLLEALANVYKNAGDKPKAVQYINEAQTSAPDDPYINAEKQFFNSGTVPPRPTPTADKVDAAMTELKAHMDKAMALLKMTEDLNTRVQNAYFGRQESDSQEFLTQMRSGFDTMIDSLAEPKRLAKMTVAQFHQAYPGTPDSVLAMYRNIYYYTIIIEYFSVTQTMLRARAPQISEQYDVGFWAETLNMDPVRYAQTIKSLHDFEYEGEKRVEPGYYFEDWTGVYALTLYDYAGTKRREGHAECMRSNRGDIAGERACIQRVDEKYCATIRKLHKDWMDGTESHVQRIGRRFDSVASTMLYQAGNIAADAFDYGARYAKEMKIPANDAQQQGYIQEINAKYKEIVGEAVGDLDGGPSGRVRFQAETYQIYKRNAEQIIASYKRTIEETCQPVDQRALEQLLEEQRKAMRQMLLDKLMHDLNVSWNANADCSFSMGKWISVSVDIDGNVNVKGKWSPYKKAFDGSPTFDVNKHFKFDIKDARYVSATATADKSYNSGIFTGKGTINMGVSYDTQTGQVSYPVNIEGKLGVGYKTNYGGQEFGVSCYPGSIKANFDARVIASDIAALING